MRRLLAAAALTVLALAGCGEDATETVTSAPDKAQQADLAAKPKVEVPDGPAPTELVISDIEQGTGAEATVGSNITVRYVGVTYADGKEFDASWNRGQDFTFVLGAGKVIPGWDRGFAGMKEGGRRQLVIPPDLGYGAAGSPPDIPPNSTLVFVVDLVKVAAAAPPAGPKPTVTVPKGPAPTDLVVTDLKPGTGAEAVDGKQITVRYVGVTYADGKEFDSSWGGDDFTFVLGAGDVIQGWDSGFKGMKEGGRRQLVIPPQLAYGEQGSGPIGPNSTLVFVVDLVQVG